MLLHAVAFAPLLAQPAVTGQVVGSDDEPIAGALIELSPVATNYEAGRLRLAGRGLPPPLAVAECDEEGRFRLPAPHAGVWRIVARAAGRVAMQHGPILLIEPEELPPVRLERDAGSRVEVVAADGGPVAGAWVIATAADDGATSRAGGGWQADFRVRWTAADGTLLLPRRADERLRLTARAPDGAEESRSDFVDGTVRLVAAAREILALRVVSGEGEVVPGVIVRSGPSLWPVGLSGADGRLSFAVRREEAPAIVLVTADGRQHPVTPGAAGEDGETTVVLPPALQVRGRVLDVARGRGLEGAFVWLAADPAVVVRTDGDGAYDLLVPTGQRVALIARAVGFLPERRTVAAAELAHGRLPSLALERAAEVAGTVVDPDGRPVAGATVEAVHSSSLGARTFGSTDAVSDRAASGPDGRFALGGLRTSEGYELRVRKRGYFPSAEEVVARGFDSRRALLRVRLRPVCGVHGGLRDPRDRPVAGAVVLMRPASRVEPAGRRVDGSEHDAVDTVAGESDPEGRFAIAAPPAEELDLEVRKAGFAPAHRRSVRIDPRCRGSFDVGTVVLQPGVRVAGRVVDRRGRAVGGAEVFLVGPLPPRDVWSATLRDRRPVAVSDREGRFVLEDLPAGEAQHLLVRAPRFLVAAVRGVRPPLPQPVVVALDPAVSLHGRVVDARRTGVGGARVDLYWQATLPDDPRQRPVGELVRRSVVSDAEGRFEIGDVPEGAASLHVVARGYVPVENVELRLPRDDAEDELVLVLEAGASLEGRVATDAGDPVEGVRLAVGGHTATSDAEGFYSLDGIAPGEQEMLAFHPHYPRLLRPVLVEEGVNRLDVELEAGVEVAGRVLDADGQPAIAAEVALTPRGRPGLRVYETRTGEDGSFALRPVADGHYRLEARGADLAAGEFPAPVVVADDPIRGLEIVLRLGATITGLVLGLDADELAQVTVTARGEAGDSRPARVDSEGRFEVRSLPPGAWLLRASLREGQRQVEARVPIAPSDRRLQQDLEFHRRPTLTGRVLVDEEPVAAGRVSLRGERYGSERSVLTAFDGSFVLQDLEPDRYWLGVKVPDRLLVHNQTMQLDEDLDVEIRIEAAAVSGTVKDGASGDPIAEALLTLRPLEGPDFLFTEATRADGTFRLFHVPPGAYRLTATVPGYAPAEQAITLAAGDDVAHLELVLSRTEGLEIEVRLASGGAPALLHVLARDEAGVPVLTGSYRVSPSGRASLSSLPPGRWLLTLGAEGAGTVTFWASVPGEPLSIKLPAAASLLVQVRELERENVIATVRLRRHGQELFSTLGPGGKLEESWTLRGGKGIVVGVTSGEWAVIAEAADGRSWSGLVTVGGAGPVAVFLD